MLLSEWLEEGNTLLEGEKRKVQYFYVKADEDHAAQQFHEKRGDIKRDKGHVDNSPIIKLVYVHEEYAKEGKRRIWQKHCHYVS